jgi:hypothetical protein
LLCEPPVQGTAPAIARQRRSRQRAEVDAEPQDLLSLTTASRASAQVHRDLCGEALRQEVLKVIREKLLDASAVHHASP